MRRSLRALQFNSSWNASCKTYAGSRQYRSTSAPVTAISALETIAKRNPVLNAFASYLRHGAVCVFSVAAVFDPPDMTCVSSSLRARIKALADSRSWITQVRGRGETDSAPLAGIHVGIPEEYWVNELSVPVPESWRVGASRLAALGCDVVSVSLSHTPSALFAYYTLAWAEASSNLARYDGIRYGRRSTTPPDTRDLQNASQKYANTRSENFGAEVQRRILLDTYVMSSAASEYYFTPSQKIRRLIQEELNRVFALPNALSMANPLTPPTSWPPGVDMLLFTTATGAAP
ncbi:Trimeric GatFAB AmidoTransferase(AdT) complex subunit [Coemansia pectinata]|uniref:Trimeric GatFAB AmidoTransferase(AdT) complex subunit n=1 Tax=Coemansia pectinata TaxID=1052879 RepID=A0A9W8LD94_9FUNG|nr:Trimeric GatFAB AmidoTransferase(AdT) complex subunit [Coemansia pectinata]